MRDTFGQFVSVGLLVLLAALGLWYTDTMFFEPYRLPPCRQQNLPEGRICLETAFEQWGDRVVWLDARDQSSYERGHITLAPGRMFPLRHGADFEELLNAALERLLDAASNNECIIVFGGSEHSDAEKVAQSLREMGIISSPVYVLEGGWERVKESRRLIP